MTPVPDIEEVEWPEDAYPAATHNDALPGLYFHGMPPGPDHPGNVDMYYGAAPEVVPADAYRLAITRIKGLERECGEWKEQCETVDAELVRECEEWQDQCRKLEKLCPDQGGTGVCDDCQPDCPCYGEGVDDVLRGPIHGTIQTLRGMCTDEADHRAIDQKLAELDDLVYGLAEGLDAQEKS